MPRASMEYLRRCQQIYKKSFPNDNSLCMIIDCIELCLMSPREEHKEFLRQTVERRNGKIEANLAWYKSLDGHIHEALLLLYGAVKYVMVAVEEILK